MATRSEEREGVPVSAHLRLIDGDLDRHDKRFEKIDARLGKIMAICVTILTALVVSSLLLAATLLTGGAPTP